jgi:Family of unknown function (DUF5723)
MKKSICIALTLTAMITVFKASAQQEQSLNFMTDTWQAHMTNPALLPSKKLSIALPSVYFNINSPDLAVNDLIVNENGSRNLYLDKLYGPERPELTHINGNVQVQTLGISFPVTNKLSLSIYQAGSANPSVTYRRDLAQLFLKGNADFLGKTVAFGSSTNGDMRSEIGIGATYHLPVFTIGGRIKFHSGIAAIFTESDKMDITFNQTDYSLGFNTDFAITSYSSEKITNIRQPLDVVNQGICSKNRGISIDLGGSMKLGKIQLNASLIDIAGTIRWQNNAQSYSSKGNYTYKGRDINNFNNFFKTDSLSSQTFIDTLKTVIGLVEATGGIGHSQKLPMKLYLSGSYQLNDKLSLGALLYNESGGSTASQTGFAVDATVKAVDIPKVLKIRAGLTYGLRNGKFNNLGAHITLNAFKVFQIFAVTDNIITVFKPYDSNSANGRVGMGLIF